MDKYKNYIDDCLKELIAKAIEAKKNLGDRSDDYKVGYNMAHYEVLSYLLNQAEAFDLLHELEKDIREFQPEDVI